MLPCISPPQETPTDPNETEPFYAYYVRLCFYVLAACLPSLPGTGRYADLTVKLPPDSLGFSLEPGLLDYDEP